MIHSTLVALRCPLKFLPTSRPRGHEPAWWHQEGPALRAGSPSGALESQKPGEPRDRKGLGQNSPGPRLPETGGRSAPPRRLPPAARPPGDCWLAPKLGPSQAQEPFGGGRPPSAAAPDSRPSPHAALASAWALARSQATGSITAAGGRRRRVPRGSQAAGAVCRAPRAEAGAVALRVLRSARAPRIRRVSRTNWPSLRRLRE